MLLQPHFDHLAHLPKKERWFMVFAWFAIIVKCILVAWAIEHWHVPIHSAWIIAPTLAFALIATGLWMTHHES